MSLLCVSGEGGGGLSHVICPPPLVMVIRLAAVVTWPLPYMYTRHFNKNEDEERRRKNTWVAWGTSAAWRGRKSRTLIPSPPVLSQGGYTIAWVRQAGQTDAAATEAPLPPPPPLLPFALVLPSAVKYVGNLCDYHPQSFLCSFYFSYYSLKCCWGVHNFRVNLR